ncbi:hypothetical protein Pdw03_3254 [Penicillium digitatum]|uniref:Uncharacterized protein n=1 Tax=Penicillium digitatum TaxID=36651 RepID=A0A7T7BHX4_PENDI|nr:hypothetical protein Pdw03_3254 [Penicillium digitatum]
MSDKGPCPALSPSPALIAEEAPSFATDSSSQTNNSYLVSERDSSYPEAARRPPILDRLTSSPTLQHRAADDFPFQNQTNPLV